ncbi:hypothetical protein, partial [Idiomarina xiamenensis]
NRGSNPLGDAIKAAQAVFLLLLLQLLKFQEVPSYVSVFFLIHLKTANMNHQNNPFANPEFARHYARQHHGASF